MASAKVRKLSQTAEIRKLTGPAFKPHEIAARLATIALRLERKADNGKGLELEEMRFLASKLRAYARRLLAKPIPGKPFSIY